MDDGANGPGDNTEAIDMDNIEIDAMNVSDEKTFLITKRKMILKKIQQDFRAQKSYEVHTYTVWKNETFSLIKNIS